MAKPALTSEMKKGSAELLILAILEDGQRRIIAYGPRGAGGDSVGEHTVFEIGSITKVFTASLLAEMVQDGEVELDDPIARHLPKSVRVPSRGRRQITLVDLSTQHSGLPRLPTNMRPADSENPYVDYTVKNLYDFLATYKLQRDIGERLLTQNFNIRGSSRDTFRTREFFFIAPEYLYLVTLGRGQSGKFLPVLIRPFF
jgi:CubicO group peptidase (beta-lactamase class C family)